MRKAAPRRMTRKKTSDLVNIFGFSIEAIRVMENMTPYLSVSKLIEGWSKYLLAAESDFERKWHVYGEDIPLLNDFYNEKVKLCKPKAQSYQIPGGRYTPDYLYIFESGLRVCVELKASKFQKGYKDALSRMRVAATLHWYDHFMLVLWDKNKWKLEEILPDKEYITELQQLADEIEIISSKDNVS